MQSIKNFVLRHANPYSGELASQWTGSPEFKKQLCSRARPCVGNNFDSVPRRSLLNRVCVVVAGQQGRLNRARDRLLLAALKGDDAGYAAARDRFDALPVCSIAEFMKRNIFLKECDALAGRPGLFICR